MREYPNIVISGNPGVGKTSLAKKLAQEVSSMHYVDFGKEAVKRGCLDGWDDELDCHILDYDKLAKQLMDHELQQGGYIVDWIHADFWPRDGLIDLVVTLTCDNTVLYDRYTARGYDQAKINENLDSEIMREILEENETWFGQQPDGQQSVTEVLTFESDSEQHMDNNLNALKSWVSKWLTRQSTTSDSDGEVESASTK